MKSKVKSTKVNISQSELEIIETFMENEKRSFSFVVSEAVSEYAKKIEKEKESENLPINLKTSKPQTKNGK